MREQTQKGAVPARLALEEEQEVYKSPSQIRRELEQASKGSQQKQIPQNTKRTQKELKPNPEKEPKQRHGKKSNPNTEKEQRQKPDKESKQRPEKKTKIKT